VGLLRLYGAHIGRNVIVHDASFFNLYRRGFRGLRVGDNCFIGGECRLDLAEAIDLGEHVTLGERALILTHTNVGYADHPLQTLFPAFAAPVVVERGAFIGAQALILPGLKIGAASYVAAGSVVTRDVPAGTLVAGVPARPVRSLAPQV